MPILDSITGLIISLFIIKSSISIFIDSNVELMDGVKDVNVYNKIYIDSEKIDFEKVNEKISAERKKSLDILKNKIGRASCRERV